MNKNKLTSDVITEHIFEIQHEANGLFLDKKGQIADIIRASEIFSDWRIDANGIQLYNAKAITKEKEAIISYNLVRFTVFDPPTKNYFEDQTEKFFRILQNSKLYNVPEIKRVGVRTKCFVPCDLQFEEINKKICTIFFKENTLNLFGGQQKDLQIIVEIKEKDFEIRTLVGPIKKNEAFKYFGFKSEILSTTGIYIDIDCFKSQRFNSNNKNIKILIDESMKMTWNRISILLDSMGV